MYSVHNEAIQLGRNEAMEALLAVPPAAAREPSLVKRKVAEETMGTGPVSPTTVIGQSQHLYGNERLNDYLPNNFFG